MRHYLTLFATPIIDYQGESYELPVTKPAWLLFYLASRRTWIHRDELVGLFRPDTPEELARHYLRNLLNRAQRLPGVRGLELESKRCRWLVATDVAQFRAAIEAQHWLEAINLYKGPLLADLNCPDMPLLESWLDGERTELQLAWQKACLYYAADMESSDRYLEAVTILERLLRHDNLNEEALQHYMRSAYLAGQRELALKAAARFSQELHDELGMTPLTETLELTEKIRHSEPITKSVNTRRRGRRWTDYAKYERDNVEDLIALLRHPDHRLMTVISTGNADQKTLVVSRRIVDMSAALYAIVDLAEQLLSEARYHRTAELLILVMSHMTDDPLLAHRLERLWPKVLPHLPQKFVQTLRRQQRGDSG
jgi:DNA-binding SARP family transcriptional activator